MRSLRTLAAGLALIAPAVAAAQGVGVISGVVTDSGSGRPIEGVQVRIPGTAFGNVTKANGQYVILNVPPGAYTVSASRIGYSTVEVTNVSVRADVNRQLDFSLTLPGAGQQALAATDVRLFPVQFMSNSDAAKLVAPFVQSVGGSVFEAGDAIRGVTVRATPAMLARVDSLIRAFDQPPRTLRLRFQVLAAYDSATRDEQITPDVQAALREALPYRGYKLLSESVIAATSHEYSTSMTLDNETFSLRGYLMSVSYAPTGPAQGGVAVPGSVELSVGMDHFRRPEGQRRTADARLRVPLSQTVVIVSTAAGGDRRAIVLTVRPELVGTAR